MKEEPTSTSSTKHMVDHTKSKSKSKQKIRRPRGRTGRRTKEMIAIAKDRIDILMDLAKEEAVSKKNPQRAMRYVQHARNLGMKYNIRIDRKDRNHFCRTCNSYLGPTLTSRVRCQNGRIIIHCKNCGRVKRIPIY
jgi:ribonuclease P protein subunit RPR2